MARYHHRYTTAGLYYFLTSAFSILCIWGKALSLSREVRACWTLYISLSLVFLSSDMLRGNKCLAFSCFRHFFANLRQSEFLLSLSVSKLRVSKACGLLVYISCKITFHATFCTRSMSVTSSSEMVWCQTWQLCSRIDLIYRTYISTIRAAQSFFWLVTNH